MIDTYYELFQIRDSAYHQSILLIHFNYKQVIKFET